MSSLSQFHRLPRYPCIVIVDPHVGATCAHLGVRHRAIVVALFVNVLACGKTPRPAPLTEAMTTQAPPVASTVPSASALPSASVASEEPIVEVEPPPRDPGPFNIPFGVIDGKKPPRNVFVIAAKSPKNPQRLIAFLHGICNPPEYACGLWQESSVDLGFLVCPTGDASCGPGQYNAPTWGKPESKIDEDLETAVEAASAQFPGAISRDDAVLCGFSRGAYMAVRFALAHPGRWPYLVLNEANVTLDAAALRKAKVRAVALIAGELGGQIGGEKKTVAALEKAGFPVKFWPMPKAGHWYSEDIAQIMREAVEFVTSHPE